ncbi:MAG: zinc ribbon domain-containing protein [Acidobacteria bacterium]|nr:zinc ribbon domain-containing protein [Acidobacteriota bacterium]
MPLYEYECLKCHHRFELIRKFSDPPLTKCIKCGGKVEKLMSAPAIAFKGSGWYVTDYGGKKGGGEPTKSEPKGDSKSESKSDSKTETTSEVKTESKSDSTKGAGGGSKGNDAGDRKKGKSKS